MVVTISYICPSSFVINISGILPSSLYDSLSLSVSFSLSSPFKMAPPHSKTHREFPEHLLHRVILPRVPYKTLNRFKCISKDTYSLITADAQFAADQARSADASSSGFVYMTPDGNVSFFPDPALIGVPDPSLKFLNPTSPHVKLLSSTNGLFLLTGEFNDDQSLCVCNPATKETAFIPDADSDKHWRSKMGLAYDPCKSPNRYTVVAAILHNQRNGLLYQFDVFCSDTGKWTCSSRTVYLPTLFGPIKAECAKGVIYWLCGDHLLWYDTEKDLAGYMTLPVIGEALSGSMDVGVYAGEIMFYHAWEEGIEVWRLTNGSHWDRLHVTSWEGMMHAFDFCHGMRLRCKSQSDMFFRRRVIQPVGYDGRFVYFTVRLRYRDHTEKLFGWETVTRRVEAKGQVTTNRKWQADQVFRYANSMARVPQILGANSS